MNNYLKMLSSKNNNPTPESQTTSIIIFWLFFWFCWDILLYLLYYYLSPCNSFSILSMMGFIAWLQFFLSLLSYYQVFSLIICPYNVFLLFLFLFSLGQTLLYPFNAVSPERDLLNNLTLNINNDSIFQAQYVSLLFVSGMHIGALIAGFFASKPEKSAKYNKDIMLSSMNLAGIFLLVISTPAFIISTISTIITVSRFGYGEIYAMEDSIGLEKIFMWWSNYFIPSILCLMTANYKNSRRRNFLLFILVIYILIGFFIGGRTPSVVILCILVLYFHYAIRPLNLKKIFLTMVCALITINICVNVAETRLNSSRSFYELFLFNTEEGKNVLSPVGELFSECGWSMFPLLASQVLFPATESFRLGSSYAYAFLSLIPNLNFWPIHPAKVHSNWGDWLQEILRMSYGPGFSTVAEAYVNFGIYGFFFCIFYGFIQNCIFKSLRKETIDLNPILFFCILLYLQLTLPVIRNSFLGTVRVVGFYIIPIIVVILFIYYENLRRHRH